MKSSMKKVIFKGRLRTALLFYILLTPIGLPIGVIVLGITIFFLSRMFRMASIEIEKINVGMEENNIQE